MKQAPNDLTTIPGVGKSISADLQAIGIQSAEDLKGESPERFMNNLIGLPAVYKTDVYYTCFAARFILPKAGANRKN